jgi:hypothetical protein
MKFTMPSNQQYNNKEYLSTVLETMKQKMLASSAAATGIRGVAATTTIMSSGTTASELVSMPFGEIIVGVGYILLILVFVTRVFFKTLNRFTTYYSSSSSHYSVSQNRGDGPYNRFGFVINADSDCDDDEDKEEVEKNISSPRVQHLCQQTPPQSPPPPLRRSKRLQMKSLTILEKMLEKQTQTHPYYSYSSSSSSKVLFPSISSDPLPLPNRRLSFVSPSLHPEHDEELAFEINRRYEKRMQKRSECNSPPLIRRLIL